ncbi:MAG: phosphopantetheine-binding protein [Alphaproteobacteria bacterium]
MVPSDFISLDAFPLTPNRKVDRAALPVPEPRRFDNDKFFIAPRNPVEQRVADIWTQILKRESVGILENFFYIGGHSLLAMRLVSRISREFAMNFPLRKFFENPTIADVALQIEEIQRLRSIPERLTNVLASIETLSDEEAELLLVQERSISRIDARKIK